MPIPEHIQQQLERQQEEKKRGVQHSFGRGGAETYRLGHSTHPETIDSRAQGLVELESMFGQQAVALEAQLRSMLMTLRKLQQSRMDLYGGRPPAAEKAFATDAEGFIEPPQRG